MRTQLQLMYIRCFLQNDNIVVRVKPESKVNQGNTMVKTQIWGDYGRGWFLIKDYNSNTENNSLYGI